MQRSLLLAPLATACLLITAGCGDDAGDSMTATPNGTDRAFAAAMVPHHEEAVAMAKVARKRAGTRFVRDLADAIVRTQTQEIATLRREVEALDTAGVEEGTLGLARHAMGMDADAAALQDARPFDPAFLKLMIPHHEGAIAMSEAELAKGGDPELRQVAQRIIDAQRGEIARMRRHLGGAGGHPGS